MHNKSGNENVTDKAKSRSLNISMITLTRSVSPSKYDWIFFEDELFLLASKFSGKNFSACSRSP